MINEFLQFVFWLAFGLIVYVYIAFPAFLFLLARFLPKHEKPGHPVHPAVSLVISAHNERHVIRAKLHNSLLLTYPRELLQVILVSDCSDDGTDEVVREFAPQGVVLVRQKERLGKSAGLNLALPACTGSVVVFSDANAIYQPDAITKLVTHFDDPAVGYVVGNACYVESKGGTPSAKSEGLYWKLETWLKQNESQFGSLVGGDGAIYAIRRHLYSPLRPTDINDLLNPLQIILQGYRGVYERLAVCTEEAGNSFEKEFRRKIRIVGRSLNAVRRAARVLLPWNNPRHWFALVSHKLLRWFVPVFLLVLFFTSVALSHVAFYRYATYLQAFFYSLAMLGWAVEKRAASPKLLYISYYFCLVNLASLFGIVQLCRGALSPTWKTIRDDARAPENSSTPLVGGES